MTKLSAGVGEIMNESLLCVAAEYRKVATLEFLLLIKLEKEDCVRLGQRCRPQQSGFVVIQIDDRHFLLQQRNLRRVFEYYENILETIRTFILDPSKLEFIRDMQQTNDQLGGLRAVETSFKNAKLLDEKTWKASNIQLLITNVPKLTQANILQSLKQFMTMRDITASHIFTTLSDFEKEFWCHRFRFVSSSDKNLITFVINVIDVDFAQHKNIWEFVGDKNVVTKLIFDERQEKFFRIKLANQLFEVTKN